MARNQRDSASLFEEDRLAAQTYARKALPLAGMAVIVQDDGTRIFSDGTRMFTDPGSKYASLNCPNIYEALRRKGYSKEKAARISNAKCGS